MSPQLMLPKMKMRSTEGSGGQRTPSVLNAQNCAHEPRDPNNAFVVVADREYCMLIGANTEAALLAQQLPPNPQI
jgi:hypothetical protein